MKAQTGDLLILAGTHVGDAQRVGVVVKVHGVDGAPPYVVRWEDNGHETLCFPGPDACIQPSHPHQPVTARTGLTRGARGWTGGGCRAVLVIPRGYRDC